MPFVVKGNWTCQVDWGLSMDSLLLGPSAPGRIASFGPMMGKGLVWDSMVCMLLSE